MDDIRGKWALVTGASGGLGADFARRLAERGAHTVLVARREHALNALASELEGAHAVQTRVIAMDLGAPNAATQLFDQLTAEGLAIEVLVNNAGFGLYGDFLELDWERQHQMLQLDIVALTQLTHLFVAPMVERGHGYVLQVASLAGYQPAPSYASYAAAKAYVLNFGEAVAYELRNTGVQMTVLSPGAVATEFLKVSGQRVLPAHRLSMTTSAAVTTAGIRAMLRGRVSLTVGLVNVLTILSLRLIPRRVAVMIAELSMRGG